MCESFFGAFIVWGVLNFVFIIFSVLAVCGNKKQP